jgi:hypothetical protein
MLGPISGLIVFFIVCPARSSSLSNLPDLPTIHYVDAIWTTPAISAANDFDCANLPAPPLRNAEVDLLRPLEADPTSPSDQQQRQALLQQREPQQDETQQPEAPPQGSPFALPHPVPLNAFQPMEPLAPINAAPPHVQWVSLMGASLRYLGIMHSFRLLTEPATRYAFQHNPFWGGYLAALGAMHGWSDGDTYYENYLGHPIQGAVSGYIWIHNDPKYRNVEFGRDPNYWKSRMRAYAYAWAFSEQFEVGLISEASIGQIQRYCCQFGFVDHVITPNGGMVWMVGEDIVDKYVVRPFEDRNHNLGLRIAARVALNPVQSFANLMNMEYPWHRENRGAPSHYDGSAAAFARALQPASSSIEPTTYPLVPRFEITATLPSVMQIAGLSCIGGGAVAGFRVSDSWQWTAEVSGCTLGNSLPPTWSGDSLTFTSGPEWIRHTESRWSPHAHFRFGGQKITEQHANLAERNLIEHLVPKGSSLNNYYNLFNTNYESTAVSLSVGGGVDYRLYSGFALSIANVSYVHSWLDPVHNTNFNNGVRFTTGVVLRLGTW